MNGLQTETASYQSHSSGRSDVETSNHAKNPGSLVDLLEKARKSAAWWSTVPPKERAKFLRQYRDRLIDRMEELVAIVGREINKPRLDVVGEITQACDLIGYLAKRAPKWLRPRKVYAHLFPHKRCEIHHRPMGVVAAITPCNYPIVLALVPVIEALMAGNTVILKPSEFTAKTAEFLCDLFRELPLTEPVVFLFPGGAKEAIALAESNVDKISFTGGRVGATAILTAAAQNLTPVVLELGGKDPMIVCDDADIERAARGAVWGAFYNAGQSCIAVERCFVTQPIAAPFIARVIELTNSLTFGPSVENTAETPKSKLPDKDIGTIISPAQRTKVKEIVEDAIAKGAKVLTGGTSGADASGIFPPTVLTDVNSTMRLSTEEIFGPILTITTVNDVEEALRKANDTDYGLGGSVWTKDVSKGREIASRIQSGGVTVNDCLVHFGISELPFGGVKKSGFGRSHGKEGLLEYCQTQTITSHRVGLRFEPHWFPSGFKYRWLQRATRFLFHSGFWARFRSKRS